MTVPRTNRWVALRDSLLELHLLDPPEQVEHKTDAAALAGLQLGEQGGDAGAGAVGGPRRGIGIAAAQGRNPMRVLHHDAH